MWVKVSLTEQGIQLVMCYAGPAGALAASVGMGGYNLAKNWDSLQESERFTTLAFRQLESVNTAQYAIFRNSVNGLATIVSSERFQINAPTPPSVSDVSAEVQPVGMTGMSVDNPLKIVTYVRRLPIKVSFRSDSEQVVAYRVFAFFDSELPVSGRFGQFVAEGYADAARPETSVTFDLRNDALGLRGWLPGSFGTPKTLNIDVYVLAVTLNGTYYAGKLDRSLVDFGVAHNPHLGGASFALAANQPGEETMYLPYPLSSNTFPLVDGSGYRASFTVLNPFRQAVQVTLAQPVPPDMSLGDTGTGVVKDQLITWTGTISPFASLELGFDFSTANPTAQALTLAPATLEMKGLETGHVEQFETEPAELPRHQLVTAAFDPSLGPLTGAAATIPLTLTNTTSVSVTGQLRLELVDATGIMASQVVQDSVLAPWGETIATVELPAPPANGSYSLRAIFEADARKIELATQAVNWQEGVSPTPSALTAVPSAAVLDGSSASPTPAVPAPSTGGGAMDWLVALFGIVVLGLVTWVLLRSRNHQHP